jgi:hypothetical protein
LEEVVDQDSGTIGRVTFPGFTAKDIRKDLEKLQEKIIFKGTIMIFN